MWVSSAERLCWRRVSGQQPPRQLSSGTTDQGRIEVRWHPGQEASLAPPYLNLRSFGSKCTELKKVLVTLLRPFGAPTVIQRPLQWFGARGIVPPLPTPRYAPATNTQTTATYSRWMRFAHHIRAIKFSLHYRVAARRRVLVTRRLGTTVLLLR